MFGKILNMFSEMFSEYGLNFRRILTQFECYRFQIICLFSWGWQKNRKNDKWFEIYSIASTTWTRLRKLIILIFIVAYIYWSIRPPPPPTPHRQRPTMKFLLILSIAMIITGSSDVDTTDNRQLQGWNPNCNTLAFWHPVYTGKWSSGFCSLQITCNSPSYLQLCYWLL